VLRYAHEHGCPWDWTTCRSAAEGGHLEVRRCCGTRTSTADPGTAIPAGVLLREGTSRCCNTRTSTAARGTRAPATVLLREGTSRCCGTRSSTAARCRRGRWSTAVRRHYSTVIPRWWSTCALHSRRVLTGLGKGGMLVMPAGVAAPCADRVTQRQRRPLALLRNRDADHARPAALTECPARPSTNTACSVTIV
jgi:hypothetical protein